MVSDPATNEWLAAAEEAGSDKLDDTEIQRLVTLSRTSDYRQSDRVPVKSIEAFEPKSLVSIAMEAQRRRESEMRTAMAAGVVVDNPSDEAQTSDAGDVSRQAEVPGDAGEAGLPSGEAVVLEKAADQPEGLANELPDGLENTEASGPAGDQQVDADGDPNALSSEAGAANIDFEAGQQAGIEEGRKVGFDEGYAKGLEEGKAAGRAEASAQLERTIQAFEAATEKLSMLTEIDSEELAGSIRHAIVALASERAGQAIADLPSGFAARIETLLATVHTVSGEPLIRLNSADLASIAPLIETRDRLKACRFVADDRLAHGDLTVSVGSIGLEDVLVARQDDAAEDSSDDAESKIGVEPKADTIVAADAGSSEPADGA